MADESRVNSYVPGLRIQHPERRQLQFRAASLDQLVSEDHPVRAVWEYALVVDLESLYAKIRTVEDGPGRPPIDPRILFALWVYATLDGIGSARRLEVLCEQHQAYQWICGGVSVNYHTLSDFRVDNGELLERLLINSVAALLDQKLVTMNTIAQDGMRVRASAGSSSFRRKERLSQHLEAAERQVEVLRKELLGSSSNRREDEAKKRVAKDRADRVRKAIVEAQRIQEAKKKNGEKGEARASTTDPEARVMKMADGGFRPALNIQFVTDVDSRMVIGVAATNSGSDKGQLVPMMQTLRESYGRAPKNVLVDGDFITKGNLETLSSPPYESTVYAPVPKPRESDRDRYLPDPHDTPAMAKWRRRMSTPRAQERYRKRSSTAEWTNALARNRGLTRLLVRGLKKVKAVALWFALTHNWRQMQLRLAR